MMEVNGMGLTCESHLADKVRSYMPDAENGAVTVQFFDGVGRSMCCDYCKAHATFVVSYSPKGK